MYKHDRLQSAIIQTLFLLYQRFSLGHRDIESETTETGVGRIYELAIYAAVTFYFLKKAGTVGLR